MEHMAQFGMHDMWDEADQMMTDGFSDQALQHPLTPPHTTPHQTDDRARPLRKWAILSWQEHGFTRFLPLNEATFTRLEQYACIYHNWHVYDFLLTKERTPRPPSCREAHTLPHPPGQARHLVPPFRTAALLVRARMVFQDAYIPQTWLQVATAAAAVPTTGGTGVDLAPPQGTAAGLPQSAAVQGTMGPVVLGPGGVPVVLAPVGPGGVAMPPSGVPPNMPLQGVIAGAMSAMEQMGGQGVGEATVLSRADGDAVAKAAVGGAKGAGGS